MRDDNLTPDYTFTQDKEVIERWKKKYATMNEYQKNMISEDVRKLLEQEK